MALRISLKVTNIITTSPSNMAPAMIQPVATAMPNNTTAASVSTPIQAKLEATSRISNLKGFNETFNIR